MPSDALPDDPMMLKAMLLAERVQNERLRHIIRDLQRHQFGRRAETLPEDQMLLGLEDVEQTAASDAADAEQATPDARQAGAAKRRANRGALPAHLPRIETTIDIDDKTCRCCRGALPPDRRRQERTAGYRAGSVPGAGHDPAEIRLPHM
jgi:transposase